MAKSERTPGPWTFRRVKNESGDTLYKVHGFIEPTVAGLWCPPGHAEQEANAEFIVRACNSHDDLLAACRKAEQFIRNGIEFGFIRMPEPSTRDLRDAAHDTLPAICAAIAKAAT